MRRPTVKPALLCCILAAAAAAPLATGANAPKPVHAKLTAVAPAQGGSGTLTGTALEGKSSVVFRWRLALAHLSGPATGATLKVTGGNTLAFALCKPCSASGHGNISLISSLWKKIATGKGVLVVTTAAHPAGELRGPLKVG